MTTLSEYPGEKMPHWAVAIWYRCKFCKICVQFEQQLIDHKREKHFDEMKMCALAAKKLHDTTEDSEDSEVSEESNSSSSDGGDDVEDDEEGTGTLSEEDTDTLPEEDTDTVSEEDTDTVSEEDTDTLSTSTEPIPPLVDLTDVLDRSCTFGILNSHEQDPTMEATCPNPSPVIFGCDKSDEEIEIIETRSRISVNQLKYIIDNTNTTLNVNSCTLCDKTYKSSGGLTRHMRINHPLPPVVNFSCSFCKKKFSSRYLKAKHFRNCLPLLTKENQSKTINSVTSTSTILASKKVQATKQIMNTTRVLGKRRKRKCTLNSTKNKVSFNSKGPTVQANPTEYVSKMSKVGTVGRPRLTKGKFECKFCKALFNYKGNFTNHLISRHSKMRNYRDPA